MTIAQFSASHPSRQQQPVIPMMTKPVVIKVQSVKKNKNKNRRNRSKNTKSQIAIAKHQIAIAKPTPHMAKPKPQTVVVGTLNMNEIKAKLKSCADKAFIQIKNERSTLYIDNIATCQKEVQDIRNEVMYAIRQSAIMSKIQASVNWCDIFKGQDEVDGHKQSSSYRACVQFKTPEMAEQVYKQRFPPVLNGVAMGVRTWNEYSGSPQATLDDAPQTIIISRAIKLDGIPPHVSQPQVVTLLTYLLQKVGRDQDSMVHCCASGYGHSVYVEFSDVIIAEKMLALVEQIQSGALFDNTYHSLLQAVSVRSWSHNHVVVSFFMHGNGSLKMKPSSILAASKESDSLTSDDSFASTHSQEQGLPAQFEKMYIPSLGTKHSFQEVESLSCPSLKDESVAEGTLVTSITETPRSEASTAESTVLVQATGPSLAIKSPEHMTMHELLQAFHSMKNEIVGLQTEVATLKIEKVDLQKEMDVQCETMADDQVQIYKELAKERLLRHNAEIKLQELQSRGKTLQVSSVASPRSPIVEKAAVAPCLPEEAKLEPVAVESPSVLETEEASLRRSNRPRKARRYEDCE